MPLRLLASSAFGGWLRQEAYREYLDPVSGETARHCRLQLSPAVTTPFSTAGGDGVGEGAGVEGREGVGEGVEGVEGREGVGEGAFEMVPPYEASPTPPSPTTTTGTVAGTTAGTGTGAPDSADSASGKWSWPGPVSVSPSTGLSAEAELVSSCGLGPYPSASSLQRKRAQVTPPTHTL